MAFDGKLDNVNYVLHLASPLVHGTNKETYFNPAVKGTMALLKAVIKSLEDNDWDFSVDENVSFDDPQNPAATPRNFWLTLQPGTSGRPQSHSMRW